MEEVVLNSKNQREPHNNPKRHKKKSRHHNTPDQPQFLPIPNTKLDISGVELQHP